jgi:hypothetical protein
MAIAIQTKQRFYSRLQGAMFYAASGKQLQFMGNPAYVELDVTKDAETIKELLAAAAVSAGNIFTTDDLSQAPDMVDAISLLEEDIKKTAIAAAKLA